MCHVCVAYVSRNGVVGTEWFGAHPVSLGALSRSTMQALPAQGPGVFRDTLNFASSFRLIAPLPHFLLFVVCLDDGSNRLSSFWLLICSARCSTIVEHGERTCGECA